MAWQKIAQQLGIPIDREFNEQLKGIGRMDSLELILQQDPALAQLSDQEKEIMANRKNEQYLELVETIDSSNILPGIEELLAANKEQGLKIALGSASKNAHYVLDRLGLTHYFDYIVDASQVSKGKPDPETFTVAADALGIEYPACIGIEDSAAGVAAINAAHMFSVGVGSAAQLSDADYLVEATSQLDFKEIVERYRRKMALKEPDK
ncbi:beta-phosphoglucomutase [Planomicrobium sp. HSC-17F08]|nr:beta-phosphoglucomutase [Planomicrobium sp. HSC-17F08]